MITTPPPRWSPAAGAGGSAPADPDRQRGLLAGGERGDDDLVEAQRKRQHAAGQQRRAELRQDHDGGRSGSRRRRGPSTLRSVGSGAAAAPPRCCRPPPRRRWRGRSRWSRTRTGSRAPDTPLRSAMPVMMPGSAIGRISSKVIVSRPKNLARASAAAASVPSTSATAVLHAATCADSVIACHMSGRVERHAEPLRGERRRREDITLVLGAERVQDDQRQRHVQERHHGPRRGLQRPRCCDG